MTDINRSKNKQAIAKPIHSDTFTFPVRVYYEDTDAGGVVYHSNYISFFERARTEWLRSLGYELDVLSEEQHVIFVVKALNCDYLRPALFNDELFVSAEILKLGNTSITFEQKILREVKDDAVRDDAEEKTTEKLYETLAIGNVTVVSVDTIKFKPKRVPKNILERIQNVI
ncbi:YbgC/FadM family acyl-CoA thioesterase [Cocleimonas sp. KMM 6892]|uniref:YbgC/FadM family acyl-CoA thioesterase n=1 Tax=unclassified Cocleimonas TaxID=2639732 RepID=UPI002DBE5459|nr:MULTISPECIES: YbgC/FadM family acyl-CoA thioesterase [unclassified Cocleimonas]MEB8431228.1 YbgC/FadM family acyl-CoA thioesterase [Cocleimonas sp. KMM 6892]MEC4714000.1 YbgC/FadM family acyl-CoA thioesterase [Cocleimonas sp. KMM 6895]MEC4743331.1 YbgC/FadM family acyl-CoA thioesterase [Cocleimonas sp. KMM 6896]